MSSEPTKKGFYANYMIDDVDPSYFAGELPESADGLPKTWLLRWENCQSQYTTVQPA